MKLTNQDLTRITKLFIDNYNEKGRPEPREYEKLWFEVITTFYNYMGYHIVPKGIREAEYSIVERGMGREYFSALIAVVKPPPELTEEERAIYLIAASPEEREKAIKKVLIFR